MATEKYLKLKDMSDSEIQTELNDIVTKYQKLKFDHAIKGLDNPIVLREIRRDIARIHSELRRRELETMSEEDLRQRSRKVARRRIKK
jgi:large subunit ribosomal protein L29